MLIKQSELRRASAAYDTMQEFVTTKNASESGRTTAFLSHSYRDRVLAEGLLVYLKQQGWNVHIDWLDEEMPERISSQTAAKLQAKIVECDMFLFLATEDSCRRSRWCPWEIGYADGKKVRDKIAIVPTSDDLGIEYGNEYLGLYKRIEIMATSDSTFSGPALMPPEGSGTWIKSLR